ncbi:MAG: CvpA family protein [Verrucomicrobiota bacterium]
MMIPDWLSLIDVAYVAVALLFALGGLQRGFAGQVAHVITFLAMGAALFFAYPAIYSYLGRLFRNLNETYMMWLILAGLAVLTIIFFIYVSKLLANVLKMQISDRSDRTYGFTLGFVRGALVALFAMVFLVILGPKKFDDTFRAKSRVGKLVCYEMVPRIQPRLNKSTVGEGFDKMREALIHQEEAGAGIE